jgi:hypothetical protein
VSFADGGAAGRDRRFQFNRLGANLAKDAEVLSVAVKVGAQLVVEGFFELVALMEVMEALDGLLEADGNEQAYRDGGDVDDEVFPVVFGLVWDVDIEHA